MTEFSGTVREWMGRRGVSQRKLALAAHYDPGLLSKVLSGRRAPSPQLAAELDRVLDAGGEIRAAARQVPQPARQRTRRSGAVAAIQIAMASGADSADIAVDGLGELIRHYAVAVAVEPSAGTYGELAAARAFAGTLTRRIPARDRADLTAAAGWLSSLLAISATDLGDHAAAAVWCSDTERQGREARHPELLAWSALTRAVIAWYQGDPAASAGAARRGYAHAPAGTVARVKLAAQEMRARAMLGDTDGMAEARDRAVTAMDQVSTLPAPGVYSIPRAADPPYTATSLLLTGRYREAASLTRQLIKAAYDPAAHSPGGQPTNYARTLLILALAAAGMGELDEAAAAGVTALTAGLLVWPTLVLASRLDTSLAAAGAGNSRHYGDFRARYAEAAGLLALPALPGGRRAVGR